MAQQTIGVGSVANDGTGDTIRAAGGKINANFTELYNAKIARTGTVTFTGNFTFSGAVTANTSITFPTTGTLATLAGAETLTNHTLGAGTVITAATMTLGSDGTGDVYYRAANGSLTRLAAGTDGYVLTLASGLPSWAASAGGGGGGSGDALTSGTLAQFAATTSLQLKGVISDETGSGALVFATSPTISDPTITGTAAVSTLTATTASVTTFKVLDAVDQSHGLSFVVATDLVADKTFTYTGAFNFGMTLTADTSVTFPTSGTLSILGANTFTGTQTIGVTTSLLLGTAGTAVGNIGFRNATSGTATLAPPTGALGTYTVTLPNAASTMPIFGQQITFVGPTAARTITLPDAAFTVARTDAANTFTGTQTFTAPVLGTPASGNASNMTADGTNLLGYRGVPQNSKSTAYTIALADNGCCVFHPIGDNNARAFTIDSNANLPLPIGFTFEVVNMAAASCTVPITTDTLTLLPAGTTGTRTIAQYGKAVFEKITSTGWICTGNSAVT